MPTRFLPLVVLLCLCAALPAQDERTEEALGYTDALYERDILNAEGKAHFDSLIRDGQWAGMHYFDQAATSRPYMLILLAGAFYSEVMELFEADRSEQGLTSMIASLPPKTTEAEVRKILDSLVLSGN